MLSTFYQLKSQLFWIVFILINQNQNCFNFAITFSMTDPTASDPIAYTGSGGPVPNGAFLFEAGATDTNDLMWSRQRQAEARVLENYGELPEIARQFSYVVNLKILALILMFTQRKGKKEI
jgi:hypothetical protein